MANVIENASEQVDLSQDKRYHSILDKVRRKHINHTTYNSPSYTNFEIDFAIKLFIMNKNFHL